MPRDSGGTKSGSWKHPLRLLEPFRAGSVVIGTAITAVGAVVFVGTNLGFAGAIGVVIGLVVVYMVGLWRQGSAREKLHEGAFIWRGVASKSDPIQHFAVKFWSSWPGMKPPPFVPRTAMKSVEDGLDRNRLVLLFGNRTSGKSRLIYEVAKKRPGQMVLVAAPAPGNQRDPLIQLLNDPVGLEAWEERQILVLRDFTKRLIAGDITGDSMRTWLDRYHRVSVVATVNPDDLSRIAAHGEETESAFEEVAALAQAVGLEDELDEKELEAAQETFPNIDAGELRQLPRYMVLEDPLRERLEAEDEKTELGRAIVRAVADWQRVGLARPAPERFLRAISRQSGKGGSDAFDAALRWAAEPVRAAARLVYPVAGERDESLYEADRVVIDLLDAGDSPQPITDSTWEAIYEEIVADLDGEDEGVTAELIVLGEGAMARGRYDFGRDVLENAQAIGSAAQEQLSSQVLASGTRIRSVVNLLVDSRRGDSIRQRIQTAQNQADERQASSADSDAPGPLLAAIYRRRGLRTFVRALALMLADIASAAIGLAAGMALRAFLSGNKDFPDQLDVFLGSLAPWGAATIFAFALFTLYKQDAPRARLGAILLAMGMLGVIGLVAGTAADFELGAAIPAAIVGTLLAASIDYRLRVLYDSISRSWVWDHGLEARTLLIGSAGQVAAVEAALPVGISRPTNVRGYLTPGSDNPGQADNPGPLPIAPWLGSVDELAKVVVTHDIGRVLIANHDMSPRERQALADRCHLRNLVVEAVPSPSDIQAGTADFVAGQSLILIPLVPLWRGHTAFVTKRVFDFTIALVALILLWPLLTVIAILILIFDRTPIVVRSWRPGVGREVFGMYRFRTTNERRRATLDSSGRESEGRPTALGKKLRNRGLDELPQLFNILLGDMSLVGPRPLKLSDDAKLRDWELIRYVVRPGATSPWQVSGREVISFAELTALDMAYLRHWTIVADLEILVKTARLVLRGREKLLTISAPEGAEPEETA
jgi:lipopolysaccharide/colanic/teichoic acid biosynthesis glycosyltransferase